ncbi:MAG: hypothetical protein JXM73_26465 [Anaerolineae bacterium]|nr:hypothetical protein [Anaerolineae bacterium]
MTFYTRVEVCETPVLTLEISLPKGLILDNYRMLDPTVERRERQWSGRSVSGADGAPTEWAMPRITTDDGAHHLIWLVPPATASACYEYQVTARVAPAQHDLVLESNAVVASGTDDEWSILDRETATIAVSTTSEYLRYLPAIYREDDLMGRFLMLFDSFWKPLERQIDDLWLYFDPRLTPPEFLPWLASWLSLVLDESWPEEKQRQLIRSAIFLCRKRGTKQGLEEYLTIYTGVRPHIVEHRAYDFCLGSEARLGPGIALGKGNVAHAFTVTLHLPPVPPAPGSPIAADQVRKELARQRRHKIEAIIEAEKPAHTSYTLHIETDRLHET